MALAERPKEEIADGYAEAADVMRLVVAGRRPGGAYRLSDVLVEYAVTSHERVTENLAAVIKPLRAHGVLWETLTVLIDADYNRNKAARDLFIHRSTIDYRLWQIEQLTGLSPVNPRDLAVLGTAIAMSRADAGD